MSRQTVPWMRWVIYVGLATTAAAQTTVTTTTTKCFEDPTVNHTVCLDNECHSTAVKNAIAAGACYKKKASETYVITQIFPSTYETFALPPTPVPVELSIAIRNIQKLDTKEGLMRANTWTRLYWSDARLRFNNLGFDEWPPAITLPTNPRYGQTVWVPDIMVWNTAEKPEQGMHETDATIYGNGDVFWTRPGMITVTCKFALEDFPFDTQLCPIEMGSWAYDASQVKMVEKPNQFSKPLDFDFFVENEEFKIRPGQFRHMSTFIAGAGKTWESVIIELSAERKNAVYERTFMIPTIVLCLLCGLAFFVPWNVGERITFSCTMMLTMVVFIIMVQDALPKTDQVSVISNITSIALYITVSSLFLCVIFTAFEQRRDRKNRQELDRQAHAKQDKQLETLQNMQMKLYTTPTGESSAAAPVRKMMWNRLKNTITGGDGVPARNPAAAAAASKTPATGATSASAYVTKDDLKTPADNDESPTITIGDA